MADPRLTHVKLHPDIGLAALQRREDREARLWTLLHALDAPGRGWWYLSELRGALAGLGLQGLSRATVDRLLAAGDGTYWTLSGDHGARRVWLTGLEGLAVALGCDGCRQAAWVPIEHVRRLRTWRGAILAAFHASRSGSRTWGGPISRRTLEELTSYGARTQRGWEKALGNSVKARPNAYVCRDRLEGRPSADDLKRLNNEGKFVDKVRGQVAVLAWLPSSYWSAYRLAPRGQSKRVHKRVRPVSDVRGTHTRLFYDDPRGLVRRVHGLGEGERVFGGGANVNGTEAARTRGGWHLWTRYSMEGGGLCYR